MWKIETEKAVHQCIRKFNDSIVLQFWNEYIDYSAYMRLCLSEILGNLLRLHVECDKNFAYWHVFGSNITFIYSISLYSSYGDCIQQRVVESTREIDSKKRLVCKETSDADEVPSLLKLLLKIGPREECLGYKSRAERLGEGVQQIRGSLWRSARDHRKHSRWRYLSVHSGFQTPTALHSAQAYHSAPFCRDIGVDRHQLDSYTFSFRSLSGLLRASVLLFKSKYFFQRIIECWLIRIVRLYLNILAYFGISWGQKLLWLVLYCTSDRLCEYEWCWITSKDD